jgi:hypothetical protein
MCAERRKVKEARGPKAKKQGFDVGGCLPDQSRRSAR